MSHPPALDELFRDRFGRAPQHVTALAGGGSNRPRWRLAGGGLTAIGVRGEEPRETRAFLSFTRTFRDLGLPVPQVYGADEPSGTYLEEDLGDQTLFAVLEEARRATGRVPGEVLELYRAVLAWLPRFQLEGGRALDFSVAYPVASFDRRAILWDLDSFKHMFLRLAHVPFDEARLQEDFERLADALAAEEAEHFLHRDLQSRNVMIRAGKPVFIDYQGGRRGPLAYDVASLLHDGRAALPEDVREILLEWYVGELSRHVRVDARSFRRAFDLCAVVRYLQALGAYGYRGFYERKRHFLSSVAPKAAGLRALLAVADLGLELGELRDVLERVTGFADPLGAEPVDGHSRLVVDVRSFRFRRGPVESVLGHGVGWVFDCRGLDNPGRDPAFADLTGRDEAVVRFLEARPEVEAFFRDAFRLVSQHVETWRARGFDSLLVQFGCTGGRHRSVYFAERLARALAERHPDVHVRLAHGEEPTFRAPAGAPRG